MLALVAALPFAAAEAAGALLDLGVQPWRARRDARGPLADAYLLFALALFAAVDGPRLVATAAGRSYLALPIGHLPSAAEVVSVGARLVAVGVTIAAPALAALLLAELGLTLMGRLQPALGRAVEAAPLRVLVVALVAAAGVYSAARALGPTLSLAARLQLLP
jgi:flagellar biosynthesis protein FliR